MVKRKKFQRFLCLLLALMCIMGSLTLPALADDENTQSTSFYTIASNASTYLSDVTSRGAFSTTVGGIDINSGSAGGFLGYSDAADDSGLILGWVQSKLSMSSATYSYDQLQPSTSGFPNNSFQAYAQFGYLLKRLGFDQTKSASTSGWSLRGIAGGLVSLFYNLSLTVNTVFGWFINILKTLNPFWFMFADGEVAGLASTSGNVGLNNVRSVIVDVYRACKAWYPLVVGAFTVALLLNIAFANGRGNGPKVKRYLIRVLAILIGIPMCASIYTTVLNTVTVDLEAGNAPSARAIFSTFLDFETWAENEFTMDESDGTITLQLRKNNSTGKYDPTDYTYSNLRRTCYNINRHAYQVAGHGGILGNWDSAGVGSGGVLSSDAITSGATDLATSGGTTTSKSISATIASLLDRYGSSDFYHASNYETAYKARMTKNGLKASEDPSKTFFESTTNTAGAFKEFVNGGASSNTVWNDVFHGDSITWQDDTARAVNAWYFGPNVTGGISDARLSPMATYNYLTSDFNGTNVEVFSNENATSGFTKKSHLSVNLIGGNIFVSFLLYLNLLVLLVAYTVLGWGYGFAMVFNSLKKTLIMMMDLPMAALGAIRSIARIFAYTAALIVEVVITLLCYDIVSQMLFAVTDVMTGVFTAGIVVNGTTISLSSMLPGVGSIIITQLLSIIVSAGFLVVALKVRKTMVKFVDEAARDALDKLFGIRSGALAGGDSGMGGRMAGAIGAGIGAGLTEKALSNNSQKDDTKGVATAAPEQGGEAQQGAEGSDKPDGGGGGPGSPGLNGPGAGEAALPAGGNTEVNIDDRDSASLEGTEDADADDKALAASMTDSLEDGGDTNGIEAGDDASASDGENGAGSQDGQDGSDSPAGVETGEEGPESGAENAQDAEVAAAAVEGDTDAALDAAGVDSAEDVQQDAQEMAEAQGDKGQTSDGTQTQPVQGQDKRGQAGKPAADQKQSGQQAQKGQQSGQGAQGQKQGSGKQTPAGVAAVGPDGKPVAGQGQPKDGQKQVGQKQGQQGMPAGQGQKQTGAAGQQETQAGAKGQKQAMPGQQQTGQPGVTAGQKNQQLVGAQAQDKGQKPASVGPNAPVLATGKPATGIPAGGQSQSVSEAAARTAAARAKLAALQSQMGEAPAVQGGQAQPGAQAPAGQGAKSGSKSQGQMPVSGGQPSVAAPGQVAGMPSGGKAPNQQMGSQAPSVSGSGAQPVSSGAKPSVAAPQGGQPQSVEHPAPGTPGAIFQSGSPAGVAGAAPVGGSIPAGGQGATPVQGAAAPSGSVQTPSGGQQPSVQAPGQVQGQPAPQAPSQPVSGSQVLQAPVQAVQAPQQPVAQQLGAVQVGGGQEAPVAAPRRQIPSFRGPSQGTGIGTSQSASPDRTAGRQLGAANKGKRSVSLPMKMAMLSFAAGSKNPLVSGMARGSGMVMMSHEMQERQDVTTEAMREGQGAMTEVLKAHMDKQTIAEYDAETEAIEAQIAALEERQREKHRIPKAKPKALPTKAPQQKNPDMI